MTKEREEIIAKLYDLDQVRTVRDAHAVLTPKEFVVWLFDRYFRAVYKMDFFNWYEDQVIDGFDSRRLLLAVLEKAGSKSSRLYSHMQWVCALTPEKNTYEMQQVILCLYDAHQAQEYEPLVDAVTSSWSVDCDVVSLPLPELTVTRQAQLECAPEGVWFPAITLDCTPLVGASGEFLYSYQSQGAIVSQLWEAGVCDRDLQKVTEIIRGTTDSSALYEVLIKIAPLLDNAARQVVAAQAVIAAEPIWWQGNDVAGFIRITKEQREEAEAFIQAQNMRLFTVSSLENYLTVGNALRAAMRMDVDVVMVDAPLVIEDDIEVIKTIVAMGTLQLIIVGDNSLLAER